MYLDKIRTYKTRQAEILEEMGRHQTADENFYITANTVMNLAARSREIFLSSEVVEKCQILNLVFQNLKLDNQKNLILEVKEPFMTLMGIKNGSIRPIDCR
jgi:site-specific DNA recombinase